MREKTNPPERIGTQGWEQFLASKQEMLYQYEIAKKYSKSRKVQTSHGNVAEACFRKWLSEFLPKRFGVTSGYIISQGFKDDRKISHYDVIIYDQLSSPTLWVEGSADESSQGEKRAIPAEYVYSIIEVKNALNPTQALKAITKLEELRPLLEEVDKPKERYEKYLPTNFCSAIVFFELRDRDKYKKELLNLLIPKTELRGYFGGLVLRGEGLDENETGRIMPLVSETSIQSDVGRGKLSLLRSIPFSDSIKYDDGRHRAIALKWSQSDFAMFAFDLVACLNGVYTPRFVSSFHGMSYLNPKRNRNNK